MTFEEQQQVINNEHLRLLRYGFMIQGAVSGMMIFVGLIYVGLGLFMSVVMGSLGSIDSELSEVSEFGGMQFMGIFYTVIGGLIVLVVAALCAMYFLSAHYIDKRKNRVFIMVAAAFSCLSIPWGTAIGICTFYVLGRPAVKDEFDGGPLGQPPTTFDPTIPPPPFKGA